MQPIDKECKYCHITFDDGMGFKKIGKHVIMKHGKNLLEMYLDVGLMTEDDFPICDGCGKIIDLRTFPRTYKFLQDPNNQWYHNNECKYASTIYLNKCKIFGKKGGYAQKGRPRTLEENEKRRQGVLKKYREDPSYHLKQSLAKLGKKNSPEHCAAISRGRKGIVFSPEHCNNLSKAISEKMAGGWYFGNRCGYTDKNKKKYIFRSSYELMFAYYLDNNHEVSSWKYESIILLNTEINKRYLPDFLVTYKNGEKHLVECDRYIGFKENNKYGWKIDLGKKYAEDNGLIWSVVDYPSILELYKTNNIKINLTTLFEMSKNRKGGFEIKKYLYHISNYNNLTIDSSDLNDPILEKENDFVFKKEISASGRRDKSKFWILANNPSFWNARWGVARWGVIDSFINQVGFVGLIKNIGKYEKELSPIGIIKQSMRERYSVSFFPAWWMNWILKGLKDEYNFIPASILDPSAGWGGRLVGSWQYDNNIEYTGVDPNINTISGLEKISNTLNINSKLFPIKFQEFDSTNKSYDLICTSPPYWDREIYDKDMINDINGYYEKMNSIDAKYLVLNIVSDDWNLNKEVIIKTLINWKLIDTWKIKLAKHPFSKNTSNKYEAFAIFTK